MDRLIRILGAPMVEHWIETGTISDDCNPWAYQDLSSYDTPEKRKEIVRTEIWRGWRRKGPIMVMLHPNYTLAFIEMEADRAEMEAAQNIQKRVKGMLTRNNFWSPYTEIGYKRINKM